MTEESISIADDSLIVHTVGQEWLLCPFDWGIDDYVTIESSQGRLVLCGVDVVVSGPKEGDIRYNPLSKEDLTELPIQS